MSWVKNASVGGRRSLPAGQQLGSRAPAAPSASSASSVLPMYMEPPAGEIALEDFEHLALERLKVLKSIEEARSKNTKEPELRKLIEDLVRKHLKGADKKETQRNDIISHFILRLAYCRTDDLRHWYLSQECDLFRFRFSEMPASLQVQFLHTHGLPYLQLEANEFSEHQDLLEAVAVANFEAALAIDIRQGKESGRMFFKVPFQEVPDLVAMRKVLLRRGFAFVPAMHLVAIVTGQFRANLSKELAILARKYAQIIGPQETGRLGPIVETLSSRNVGNTFASTERREGSEVMMSDLPEMSKKHFPLCMSNMYDRLMEDRHMRHQGRLQLGLFLKGVGMPLDEAVKFWRAAFAPKTPADQWEKQYAYGVRYNYGKEGKRKDFVPRSCLQIINTAPGVGEHHGCPYKTFDESNLRAALSRMHVAPRFIEEAVRKSAGGHFQLACASAFEGSHSCACDAGINHPNQYFDESRILEEAAGASPETPGSPPAGQSPTAGTADGTPVLRSTTAPGAKGAAASPFIGAATPNLATPQHAMAVTPSGIPEPPRFS